MKNLFNDIETSEKNRILEMHKKKGYGTISEQPLTTNQLKAQKAGYGPVSKEYAEKLAVSTKNFTITKGNDLKQVEIVGEKGFEVKDAAITRNGKIIPKKGMGSQFCYAIPADSIEAFKTRKNITQTELTGAKQQGVSPWTDVQQFFRNNDLGQCRTNDEAGLSNPMGKYVSIGSKGPFVKTIQLKLANYSEQYAASLHAAKKNDYKIDPIDGNFGKVTSGLVKDYQSHEGISPADGRVRKNTWDSLKNIRTANVYDVNTQKWGPAGGKAETLQGIKAKSVTPTDTNEPTLKV